ncbi:MAG: hypothetical protein WBM39_04960 [Parasphingorhabdus sp.]
MIKIVQFLVLSILFLGGCAAASERKFSLDQIEDSLILPEGAYPLDEYARYYASNEEGKIVAIYSTFENEDIGKRFWLDDYRKLPTVLDGGCSVVNIEFDRETQAIDSVFCNGEA